MGLPLHIEMTLSSRVDLTNLVHAASDEICRLIGMDEDSMLNLGLALREATVNAMKHGNQMRAETPVHIVFEADTDHLTVTISDHGSGFDHQRNIDPRLPENLEKTSGRGLFLIRSFVDEVVFKHMPGSGMTVSLMKRLPRRVPRRGRRN